MTDLANAFPATLDIDYPDRELNRMTTFFRPLTVIPIAPILGLVSGPAGWYPRSLFDFVVGVGRWWLRIEVYALLLTTDRYPPFRLGP